jgi:uncharacterized protein (DUF1800 family)
MPVATSSLRVAGVWLPGLLALLLSACGGGGGGGASTGPITPPPPPPPPPPAALTDADAARFLIQASFGPTHADIEQVKKLGYAGWIDDQLDPAKHPPTLLLPYLQATLDKGFPENNLSQSVRRNTWLWQAATAGDQLRMRMAFAMSEIMVVSDMESGQAQVPRVADFQDTLMRNTLGSYRGLLKAVTLHPAMGAYLSYAGNRKATADGKIVPDENYGREVMQLFSIGLSERNADFSLKKDAQGNPIPTYDQAVVSSMARVFTGWTYAGLTDAKFGSQVARSNAPMECHPTFHDPAPKTIFRGIVINAGSDCAASLEQVLDALSNHPNTAPFISRQLIQRFVTSNPSPAYIGRVTAVWTANGGNLGKVIRAILLDTEARNPPPANDPIYGKPREPLIRLAGIWRSFDAQYLPPADGSIRFRITGAFDFTATIAQDSQRAPSVFNFFQPDAALPTTDGSIGIYAPELQLINAATFTSGLNQNEAMIWNYVGNGSAPTETTKAPMLDVSRLLTAAGRNDHAEMVNEVNLLLFGGQLEPAARDSLLRMLAALQANGRSANERTSSLLMLALAAPQFAVQR